MLNFKESAQKLDLLVPLDAPAILSIKDLPGKNGESWYDPKAKQYRIVLSRELYYSRAAEDFVISVLMHEWAHCYVGCKCPSPHCEHWGAAFATCYRAIYG